jgi:hypothetical protein
MKLSVKEFSELVSIVREVRTSTGVPVAPAQPGTGVVPTPEVAYARFVIDTAELQRVVAEAKARTREACAARLEQVASECDTSLAEAARYGLMECQPGLKQRAEIMRQAAEIIRGEVSP